MTKPAICAGLGLLVASGTALASNNDAEESAEPLAASAPVVSVPLADNDMRVFWKNNLHFETADKQFTARIGGRLQLDMVASSFDDGLKLAGVDPGNAVGFRRARLYMAGTIYETISYKAQYEFAGGVSGIRDAWMQLDDFLGGALRIGQFKVPYSLEESTSSNNNTFMERSNANILARSRAIGIGYFGSRMEDNLNYGVSLTHSGGGSQPNVATGDGSTELFARVVYAVDLGGEGNLLHFGGGVGYQTYSTTTTTGYPAPSGGISPVGLAGPAFGTIGTFDDRLTLGGEFAVIGGPFHAESELMLSSGNGIGASGDVDALGGYVQGGWFVTGETRPYDKGVFGRVQPKSDWKGIGNGTGALELAVRLSAVDIDPDGGGGATPSNFTLGANWYLNSNMRIMTNYVTATADVGGSDDATALQLRFQITF